MSQRGAAATSSQQAAPSAAGSVPVGTPPMQASAGCTPEWLPTFGGLPGVTGEVDALAEFDDGTGPALYVGGAISTAGGLAVNGVAKWDGSNWSALGSGVSGGFPARVHAFAVFDDGGGPALYVGGEFTTAGGVSVSGIAKWNGSNWSELGGGVSGFPAQVHALAVFDDGSGPALYVGGEFTTAGGVSVSGIAKWNGSNWSGLGGGVSGFAAGVYTLAVFDDGGGPALYAGGEFTLAGGAAANRIAKWNGSSWSALGGGMNGSVLALAEFDDGGGLALYAGGAFTTADGTAAKDIAKWNGSSWSVLGSGVSNPVLALTVFDDGNGLALYAGGDFSSAGGVSASRIASWNGSNWSSLGGGTSGKVAALTVFDDGSGPELCAGGAFTSAGGAAASRVALWSGSSWTALGAGVNDPINAFSVFDDGGGPALFAGGHFTRASGAPASRIAKWSGASWLPLGAGVDDAVLALTVFDDGGGPALYVGGDFTNAGGASANRIARWTGSSWASLGGGLNSRVHALTVFDDGSGPALFAGGEFVGGIARWDGSSWSSLGAGTNDHVRALTVFDDGTGPALYAGGAFTTAGGIAANRIARWDGSSWAALDSGTDDLVLALAVFDDGSGPALYAGGRFTAAGVAAANRVAKWNGSSWSGLSSGVSSAFARVRALTVFDDGSGPALHVAGEFTSAGGVAASRIARWDGSSWWALGGGVSDTVRALTVFDDGVGPALYVGGSFPASPAADSFVAKWGCATPTFGTSYCTAGVSTNGCVPAIKAAGAPSISSSSGFLLEVANVEGARQGLLFYGLSGPVATAWALGSTSLMCVKAPVQRMVVHGSGGTAGACDGVFTQDWLAYLAANPTAYGQPFAAGVTVNAQCWYRDPPAPTATNLSNAIEFITRP